MRAAKERVDPKAQLDAAKASSSDVVCLVDDDPSIRKSVSRLLESAGFKVCAFSDAASFLEHLSRDVVSVAVLDIWMERMTGLELLTELCARSPATRVIFITGHEDIAAKASVTQGGVFGFLIKPFDADVFLSLVARAFDHASAPSSDQE
jgi:FixJ family two-component response regulator